MGYGRRYRPRVFLVFALMLFAVVSFITPLSVQAGGSGGSVGGGPVPLGPALKIKKIWEPDTEPREIKIQLRGKCFWEDWLVEEVVLNESNGYQAVVQDTNKNYPENLMERPNKDLNKFLYIKELGVDPKEVEISPIKVSDSQFAFTVTKDSKPYNENTTVKINLHNEVTGEVTSGNMTYREANWAFSLPSSWNNTVDFTVTIPGFNPFSASYHGRQAFMVTYYKEQGRPFAKDLTEYDLYLRETGWGGLELLLPETNHVDYYGDGKDFRIDEDDPKELKQAQFEVTILNKKPQPTETTKPSEPSFSTVSTGTYVTSVETSHKKVLPKTALAPGTGGLYAIMVLVALTFFINYFLKKAERSER